MIRETSEPRVTATSGTDRIGVELSARRTGMSFQRTRLSADRTLMSVIRTSMTLLGIGFTIFQFFARFQESQVIAGEPRASRHFGLTLMVLGVLALGGGILYHVRFTAGLRKIRAEMTDDGLIHSQSAFPSSAMLLTAAGALLAFGVLVTLSLVFRIGPFS